VAGIPEVEALAPPKNCLRPDATLHDDAAILLRIKSALSSSQCSHIIERGYQATNDGGVHFGPNYVEEATTEDASLKVRLRKPNHHKVCVFKDDTILTWLRRLVAKKAHAHISAWLSIVHQCSRDDEPYVAPPIDYIINPRLRLLRYDAIDDDDFLPHYDATTTTTITNPQLGTPCFYESKLTILCHLNADFVGGETLFLDSLQPSTYLTIAPLTGQVVIFNHELYHASSRLRVDETVEVQRPLLQGKVIAGGTKFVLRSDVMFAVSGIGDNAKSLSLSDGPLDAGPGRIHRIAVVTVADIVQQTQCSQTTIDALSDFMGVAVRTFLVPGREKLTSMLRDLGVHDEECQMVLQSCELSCTECTTMKPIC
jgi:hypothetical protein